MFVAPGGPPLFAKRSIGPTAEISRIARLPRRVWSEEAAARLAADMTQELRTPDGTMSLRPTQAVALFELLEEGGLFGPMRVGAGKTLVSLLAPFVLKAKRPILLLPAALVEKTSHERIELARHWRIPTNLQIISYEMLGRVQFAERLNYIRPDFIGADECHRLKNPRAGVTRRVARYMREHPDTKFMAISGTVMKASVRDFAQLLRWCLKDGAPIPHDGDEVGLWADALDEKVNPISRVRPGALMTLGPAPAGAVDALAGARQVFQSRLLETPGVVATGRNEGVTCSLYVRASQYDVPATTDTLFKEMRETWETPDGWAFSEAVELWRHCRELALGFHYVWDPRPPADWLSARREWAAFVRDVLSRSRSLDTELQVAQACEAGSLGRSELDAWRGIRASFTPCPRALWHDGAALDVCQAWMTHHRGIVWTEHTFFAEELARRSGAPYFGAQGTTADGRESIVDAPRRFSGRPIIASIAANGTGRNLQAWSTNLITSPPTGAATWEQLLGRTHRDGQTSDEVIVDVLFGCREHHDAITRAVAGARAAADTLGHDQKLILSSIDFPTDAEVQRFQGARWTQTKQR